MTEIISVNDVFIEISSGREYTIVAVNEEKGNCRFVTWADGIRYTLIVSMDEFLCRDHFIRQGPVF